MSGACARNGLHLPALETSKRPGIHQGSWGCLTLGALEEGAAGSVASEVEEDEAEGVGLAGQE